MNDDIVLRDVAEGDASGALAVIYGEIRRYSGVPYVSSLQRQFASLPGVLEWAWGTLRPAFASGRLPRAAWKIAADSEACRLPALDGEAGRRLGLTPADIPVLEAICENFSRVSPVNLLFARCLVRLLDGERPGDGTMVADWTPPAPPAALPAMVDPAEAPADVRPHLEAFRRGEGEQAFVPGNYRMFARWPGLIAHLAESLPPVLATADSARAMADMAAAMRAEAGAILGELPLPADVYDMPRGRTLQLVRGALAKYAKTSPEMMLVHPAICAALPDLS